MTAKGWDWVKRAFGWRTWLVMFLLALFVFAGPLDLTVRYWNFSQLSKAHVIEQAYAYARDRASDYSGPICLYEVDCSGDAARLRLVPDINGWDFQAAKDRIWHRKFSSACQGSTTNLGLQLADLDEGYSIALARWSFFSDRFIPQRSRFQSGAFSEEPWERCTSDHALPPKR